MLGRKLNRRRTSPFLTVALIISTAFLLHTMVDHITFGRRLLTVSSTSTSTMKDARYLHETDSTLPPWAHYNLMSVNQRPERAIETAIFWHIPKCGGTTAKRLYGDCLKLTLANRLGADPKFGHDEDTEIVAFRPFPNSEQTLVNVDTTTERGILRAEELGLARSRKADIIFTSDIYFASKHLFDATHRGRVLAFFRHPVDRAVSKFYYLRTATWENTYRPEWKELTVLEWAEDRNADENHMVKKILGKKLTHPVDIGDLIVAKEIVRYKFFVGLMEDMDESIRRFNIVLGIDNGAHGTRRCMDEYFGSQEESTGTEDDAENRTKATDNKNSHAHPKVEEGSPEWKLLAERNSLDMILYNYILLLFNQQKTIIDSYQSDATIAK